MFGENGADSVTIHGEQANEALNVILEKQTAQHEFQQDRLTKITNALEFTITDSDENQRIGDDLRLESIEFASKSSNTNENDLQSIAVQSVNDLGAQIKASLEAAKDQFQAGVLDTGDGATDSLEYAQRLNLQTFVRSALVDYFESRKQREANEAAYEKLEDDLANQTDRLNRIFRSVESSIHDFINLGFIASKRNYHYYPP